MSLLPSRRRFAFWIGLGLFQLAERSSVDAFDGLAESLMRSTEEPPTEAETVEAEDNEHWTREEDTTWSWYQRESLIDGKWSVTGITVPVHKWTGKPYEQRAGYLDESVVPDEVRFGPELAKKLREESEYLKPGQPDAERKSRHGRPPSRWLRSLRADELRIWLKTIEVPPAGVLGMTYLTHLTRDHSFSHDKVSSLTEDEQAKLHAAAHAGY